MNLNELTATFENLHPICHVQEFVDECEHNEGRRRKPYRDHLGNLTIGVGTLLEHGISERQIDALFFLALDREIKLFERLAGIDLTVLPLPVATVLADMAYNMGAQRLTGFKKTLTYVKAADYAAASDEMLDSRWASQVGNRAIRLSNQMRSAA